MHVDPPINHKAPATWSITRFWAVHNGFGQNSISTLSGSSRRSVEVKCQSQCGARCLDNLTQARVSRENPEATTVLISFGNWSSAVPHRTPILDARVRFARDLPRNNTKTHPESRYYGSCGLAVLQALTASLETKWPCSVMSNSWVKNRSFPQTVRTDR
jgi:hypothetical protein